MKKSAHLNEIINKLRSMGLRLTPIKRGILEILNEGAHSLTALEIQDALEKKSLTPNKSSLYRELKTLKKVKIVEEVQILKKTRSFELKKGDDHHHHFVCRQCKEITDFQNEKLEHLLKQMAIALKKKGLKIKDHELNLFGLCKACT